jgi:hypothetical protein
MSGTARPQTRARRAATGRGVRALHVGVLFAVLMTVALPAQAFWTQAAAATGSGSGSATTGSLSAPTGVAASVTNGGSDVTVSWVAPSTGVAPAGYRVIRTDTVTSSASAACGTSVSSLVTTSSCVDGSVPDGSYRYTVLAVRSGWSAPGADISPLTVLRTIATTTTLASSRNPSLVGQTLTLTATVTAASGTPTGTVVFRSGGTAIPCSGGSQTLSSGAATCVTTFSSSGSRSVTAAYAGSAPFAASTSSALTQVVNQQTQAITFTSTAPTGATVGGGAYAVSAVATSGLPVTLSSGTPSVCAVSGSTVTYVAGGACTVLADQPGNATYAPAPQASQSFSVAKAVQTVTITSAAPTNAAGGGTYLVTASATSGLAVTFSSTTASVCTVSGSTVTFVGSGSCTVVADQPGNTAYAAAAPTSQTFTVAKTAQTITITSSAPTNAAVGGATYTITATASSGLAVGFATTTPTICTVDAATVTFVGGGTCTVTADQAGNSAYSAAPQKLQSFDVLVTPTPPANLTITLNGNQAVATWTAVVGLVYECQVTTGGSPPGASSWTTCASPYAFSTIKNGTQTLWVRSTRNGVASAASSKSLSG